MKLYWVRHARGVARDAWSGDGLLRPLSERGRSEAQALAEHLAADPPARILCAPSLRCQQTAEPIAVAAGVPVEVDDRLAPDCAIERVLELLPEGAERPYLFCTHAEVIHSLLNVLELADAAGGERAPCKKGSVWVLEGRGFAPRRATYFEPKRRPRRGTVRYSAREERGTTLRAAVLDMGSTSFTLLIADVDAHGGIRPVVGEKVMLRLGAVIDTPEGIPTDVCERAITVACQLHAVAEQEKAQVFLPVATAAVRDAVNGHALAAAISEGVGQPVRILSGEEEARLIFLAFQRRLELGGETVLGLDLGGGSLELASGNAHGIATEATLPLGAVRIHGDCVTSDPISPQDQEAVRARVRRALRPHRRTLRAQGAKEAVVTGGTVRALGRLISEARRGSSRGPGILRLSADDLAGLCERLLDSSHEERLAMRGVRRQRADLLPTGALILTTLAEELEVQSLTICDWGLRQGVVLDAMARGRS